MTFFSKNSRWRHKTLNVCVRIHERYEEGYRLVWAETPLERHPLSDLLLNGLFTATDLVRDFVPEKKATRLDRLLDVDVDD